MTFFHAQESLLFTKDPPEAWIGLHDDLVVIYKPFTLMHNEVCHICEKEAADIIPGYSVNPFTIWACLGMALSTFPNPLVPRYNFILHDSKHAHVGIMFSLNQQDSPLKTNGFLGLRH